MQSVVNKHGRVEPFKIERVLHIAHHACRGVPGTEPLKIVSRFLSTVEGSVSSNVIVENMTAAARELSNATPEYATVASRLLSDVIGDEVGQSKCFGDVLQWMQKNREPQPYFALALENLSAIDWTIDHERDGWVPYERLLHWRERCLLRDTNGRIIERPQWMLMRWALARATDWPQAASLYDTFSRQSDSALNL